ncbi:phage integrase N-terminal SAM-like domain-containing protein [Paraferrimonas haliotis]|uniref:Integron integrase n=1 Tax=Paraferrimonas haliotis TaxID=2013866 RepID=A0AA37WZY6_9GAMM|nr:hypothetical protein GCM10007894_22830 [Paraferrimonas haliotis]
MSSSPFIKSVREALRVRHYRLATKKTYIHWIKRFIRFHNYRHPSEMGNAEIEAFLNDLANRCQVSSSTQNIALCALMFMYRHVLKQPIEDLAYSFAKKPKRVPTVLNPHEVNLILSHLSGKHWLVIALLFGSGLRINEALQLRLKDIDFSNMTIFVYRGKGAKDRMTILPVSLINQIKSQMKFALKIHQKDCEDGFGLASLPRTLERCRSY